MLEHGKGGVRWLFSVYLRWEQSALWDPGSTERFVGCQFERTARVVCAVHSLAYCCF